MTSRRKGRDYENEFATKYAGTRISETGMPGPDVAIYQTGLEVTTIGDPERSYIAGVDPSHPTLWEVKFREKITALNWWDQAQDEGADYLAIRRKRDTQWYIIHPVNNACPCPLIESQP